MSVNMALGRWRPEDAWSSLASQSNQGALGSRKDPHSKIKMESNEGRHWILIFSLLTCVHTHAHVTSTQKHKPRSNLADMKTSETS